MDNSCQLHLALDQARKKEKKETAKTPSYKRLLSDLVELNGKDYDALSKPAATQKTDSNVKRKLNTRNMRVELACVETPGG